MIVGEHSRDSDLEVRWLSTNRGLFLFLFPYLKSMSLWQVNPVRTKELTNIRAPGKDENVRLSPPRLVCSFSLFTEISWEMTILFCKGNTILQRLINWSIVQPCKFLNPLLPYDIMFTHLMRAEEKWGLVFLFVYLVKSLRSSTITKS